MIRKTGCCAVVAAMCVFLLPVANGDNDCCWDWSPTERGAEDTGQGGPKNKVLSDFAQCTETGKGDCFKRDGRQMLWNGYTCILGGDSPDTETPPSNANAGWFCVEKGNSPPPEVFQLKGSKPSEDGASAGFLIEDSVPGVPAVSEWGGIAMVLLVATVGTIGVRRRRARMAT